MLMWEKWQTSVYNTFWNSDYFFPGQNESIKLLLEHKICIPARNFMPESLPSSHSWTIALQFIFCLFWYVFHLHMLALNSLCSWRWPWTYILQADEGQWLTGTVLLYPIYAVPETKPEALNITDKHDTNVATFPAYLCISFTSLASLPLPECWDSHLASYFFNKENEGPCISFAYTKGYWNMKK